MFFLKTRHQLSYIQNIRKVIIQVLLPANVLIAYAMAAKHKANWTDSEIKRREHGYYWCNYSKRGCWNERDKSEFGKSFFFSNDNSALLCCKGRAASVAVIFLTILAANILDKTGRDHKIGLPTTSYLRSSVRQFMKRDPDPGISHLGYDRSISVFFGKRY